MGGVDTRRDDSVQRPTDLTKARQAYIDRCTSEAASRWDHWVLRSAKCESPIEQAFFSEAIRRGWEDHDRDLVRWRAGDFAFSKVQDQAARPTGLVLSHHELGCMASQLSVRVGGRSMRLDFAFYVPPNKATSHLVAVELDGHDFHERTKEQAKRDRSRDRLLTSAGWRVMRFTGSEIYRCVEQCWDEVEELVCGLFLGEQ